MRKNGKLSVNTRKNSCVCETWQPLNAALIVLRTCYADYGNRCFLWSLLRFYCVFYGNVFVPNPSAVVKRRINRWEKYCRAVSPPLSSQMSPVYALFCTDTKLFERWHFVYSCEGYRTFRVVTKGIKPTASTLCEQTVRNVELCSRCRLKLRFEAASELFSCWKKYFFHCVLLR